MLTPKTEALLRSLFAVDEKGNTFLRVADGQPEGDLKNAVSTQSNRSLDTLLSSAVVLDEDGNPALRLVGVVSGQTLEQREQDRRKQMEEDKAARVAAQAAANGQLPDPALAEEE